MLPPYYVVLYLKGRADIYLLEDHRAGIGLNLEVNPLSQQELMNKANSESSESIRERVEKARVLQYQCFGEIRTMLASMPKNFRNSANWTAGIQYGTLDRKLW